MPSAIVAGVELHYELYGEAPDTVLFLHGIGGSSYDWRSQMPAFQDAYRCLAADLWGHGSSPSPADFSVTTMATALLALADQLGISRFHIVGHSLGGAVAQEIAFAAHPRVRSLVLADTSDWFGDHTTGGPLRSREPDDREKQLRAATPRETFERTWQALLGWPGAGERLADLDLPTLIVHGNYDAPKIVEGSRRLHAGIPQSQLIIIDDSGHDPHIEQADVFNELLRGFLKDNRLETKD